MTSLTKSSLWVETHSPQINSGKDKQGLLTKINSKCRKSIKTSGKITEKSHIDHDRQGHLNVAKEILVTKVADDNKDNDNVIVIDTAEEDMNEGKKRIQCVDVITGDTVKLILREENVTKIHKTYNTQ